MTPMYPRAGNIHMLVMECGILKFDSSKYLNTDEVKGGIKLAISGAARRVIGVG